MHNQKNKVNKQLSGKDNARLLSNEPTNNQYTAALSDDAYTDSETNAKFPSEQNVLEAKDWVDNGSQT